MTPPSTFLSIGVRSERRLARAARALAVLLLAAPLARCAPSLPAPGELSPARVRVSNEVVAADLQTLDGWGARVEALQAGAAERPASPARRYAIAAAAAWVVFARDEYAADPRAPMADAALAEAVRLISALEDGLVAPESLVSESRLLPGTVRVRPELWAAVARLREGEELEQSAELAGELSVELVRAGRVRPGGAAPACAPALHLVHAESLLGRASEVAAAAARAGSDGRSVARTVGVYSVHFALNSARLVPGSERLLDRLIGALRERSGVTLVLEGHADPRGDGAYNVELSGRRAAVVRHYLERSLLLDARIEVRPFGHGQRRGVGHTARDYAMDRRVDVRVLAADGTPAGSAAEEDAVQEEAGQAADPRRGRPGRATRRPTRSARP